MDKDELVDRYGDTISRLLDIREEGDDPAESREWDALTGALEEDGELIEGDDVDVEFQAYRIDALGSGRLNDEQFREELALEEDDDVSDDDRAEFVRDVLREEVAGGAVGESDVHPLCRGIWIEDNEGRAALLGYAVSGEGFSGSGVEWYGLYDDEEEFRDALRSRGYLTDPEDVDEVDDDELLALWE
jgi:hypothetical protein